MTQILTRGDRTISSVCEEAGVARRTATKWVQRWGTVPPILHNEITGNGQLQPS